MQDIDGYILAGGASSRMGADKAKLVLAGATFVERAARALSALTDKIAVVGAEIPTDAVAAFDGTTLRRVPDAEVSLNGRQNAAIKGLYSALVDSGREWVAVLACDLPFVSKEIFKLLLEVAKRDNFDAVVPIQPDGRVQPLAALYRRRATRDAVGASLARGEFSLRRLLEKLRVRRVEPAEYINLTGPHTFFNVNTPEEFSRAIQIEKSRD